MKYMSKIFKIGKLKTVAQNIVGAINEVFDSSQKMYPKVYPLQVDLKGPSLFRKETTQNIELTWTITEGGESIEPLQLMLDNEEIDKSLKSYTVSGVKDTRTFTLKAKNSYEEKSDSLTVRFVNPSYCSAVAADFTIEGNEDKIAEMSELLRGTKSYSTTLKLTNQKVVYAYPASFGNLTSIKDANNFDYLSSYTKGQLTINGETYNVYLLTDPTTIESFTQIFA